jgi:hypothetical protein
VRRSQQFRTNAATVREHLDRVEVAAKVLRLFGDKRSTVICGGKTDAFGDFEHDEVCPACEGSKFVPAAGSPTQKRGCPCCATNYSVQANYQAANCEAISAAAEMIALKDDPNAAHDFEAANRRFGRAREDMHLLMIAIRIGAR